MADKNKTTGYIVFALGIVLLVVTFYLGIHTYLNPEFIEGFSDLVETENGDFAPFLDFLIYLIPPFFLFAMGSVAGKISKNGFKMIKTPEKKNKGNVGSRKKPPTTPQTKRTTPQQPKTYEEKSTAPPMSNEQQSQQTTPDQQKP